MGTEILQEDEGHVNTLAKSLKDITEYRANLVEYLKNRIAAIAPKDEAPIDNKPQRS
jgi:nucleolar protein 58